MQPLNLAQLLRLDACPRAVRVVDVRHLTVGARGGVVVRLSVGAKARASVRVARRPGLGVGQGSGSGKGERRVDVRHLLSDRHEI